MLFNNDLIKSADLLQYTDYFSSLDGFSLKILHRPDHLKSVDCIKSDDYSISLENLDSILDMADCLILICL